MIIRTRQQGAIEVRSFALTDMVRYGYDGLRTFGNPVSEKTARGIPALHTAARMRAEAIASLRLRCWSGEGPDRVRRDTVWQAQLFARGRVNEYQTRFAFMETVGESLAWRNNAYIWKLVDPLSNVIVDWYALHPDQVKCDDDGSYTVTVAGGFVDPVGKGPARYVVGPETILHIRGYGDGGTYEAPTPIQVFKDALAAPVQRQRHEAKMWARGATLQVGVEFPAGVKKSEAQEWKDDFKAAFAGTDGDTVPVVGNGATIKPIGMTAADALFVEMAKLTVHDAARIMRTPANLLFAQLERATPNLEQDITVWFRFGIGPELERIESALAADEQLFPQGAHTYPQFDSEAFIRADVATEDAVAHQQVQDGRLLVDEWRAMKGLPPLPNGAGKIPQVVPVGGAPNPNPAPAPTDSGDGEGGSYSLHRARAGDGSPVVNVYVEPILKQPPRKMSVERNGNGLIEGATLQDG